MSDKRGLIEESEAKEVWAFIMLGGLFFMILGIDLVISLIETDNVVFLIIVSGIYGVGAILILFGILGILIINRYGMKGDNIFKFSLLSILGIAVIIFFFAIQYVGIFAIVIAIMVILYLIIIIVDIKRTKKIPYDEALLRSLRIGGSVVGLIFGIIFMPFGIIVNYLISRFLPSIYHIGSYGLAFFISGGILILGSIIRLYRRYKEKQEKKHILSKKREEFNAEWLKYQYHDLGRSIQDIADELKVSMMNIRKRLNDIENNKKLGEKRKHTAWDRIS